MLDLAGNVDPVYPFGSLSVVHISDELVHLLPKSVQPAEPLQVEGQEHPAFGQSAVAHQLTVGLLGVAEAASRHNPRQHFHHQRDSESLISTEPAQILRRRGRGVGGWPALFVVGPSLGDAGIASLFGQQDLVPGHCGGGDVIHHRQLFAGRSRPGERVGRENPRSATERRNDGRAVLHRHGKAPRFRRGEGVVGQGPQMSALSHRHRSHPMGFGPLHRQLHGGNAGDLPETDPAIQHHGGTVVAHHFHFGNRAQVSRSQPGHIQLHQVGPVGVNPAEVSLHQVVDHHLSMLGGDPQAVQNGNLVAP